MEVKHPDLDAQLVASSIAEQLKKRAGFRRTMKQRAEAAQAAGVLGVKLMVAGRLGGAEMARRETLLRGSIPLHTLQAHVDYGYAVSRTTYGTIGVKCWLYKGPYGEEIDVTEEESPKRRRGYGRGKRG